MILSDNTILREMDNGNIIITPFDKKYLNPNSVDLTLAPRCKTYLIESVRCTYMELPSWVKEYGVYHRDGMDSYIYEEPLDVRKQNPTAEFDIPEEGYVLYPGQFYLYACNERIGVKTSVCAEVWGKSSLGRLGLEIHITAGHVDTGFEGALVLEMAVKRPLRIYPHMKICQVKFQRVEGPVGESYDQKAGSKYAGQIGVQESLYHKNFNNEN